MEIAIINIRALNKGAITLLGLFFSLSHSSFVSGEELGERTYKKVCISCHGMGVLNAPKFGDAVKWAPLIAEGQVILTAHGYVGIRSMPPKGGDPSLSVQDFAGALTYMVNKSSGRWQPPDAVMLTAIDAEITARRAELGKN